MNNNLFWDNRHAVSRFRKFDDMGPMHRVFIVVFGRWCKYSPVGTAKWFDGYLCFGDFYAKRECGVPE